MHETGTNSGWRRHWHEWRGVIGFLGLMLVFRSAVADYMYVPTGSMNPTLMDGDRVLIDKHAYGWRLPFTLTRLTDGRAPQRGEIVIFQSPADGKTLIKRVIGLPGDVISMNNDRLTVNGVPAAYADSGFRADADLVREFRDAPHLVTDEMVAGINHPIMVLPERAAMRSFGPVTVPKDSYWMMGDNRDDSDDSRYIGAIPRRLIFGRATEVLASLNPDRDYLPRGDRWLVPLE